MKHQKETSWDDIKAMFKESHKNFMKEMKKLKESQKETEKMVKETSLQIKETNLQMKETDRRFKETEKLIKENAKHIGGITASNGEFCEEYFINTFKANPYFLGEKYEVIESPRPRPMVVNDQYDLTQLAKFAL